jgi:hypothetical protein
VKNLSLLFSALVLALLLSACGPGPTPPASTPSATALPSPTPTQTSTPTPLPTPTSTPVPVWFEQIDPAYAQLKYRYGLVSDPKARVYVTLQDAAARNGNFGYLSTAPAYIGIAGEQAVDGKTWYDFRLGWILADEVQLVSPSPFRGLLLTRPVEFRFAWVLQAVQSINIAGAPVRSFNRYELVHEVPAVTANPGYFAIGPDEWLPLESLAVIDPRLPPEVGTGVCRFIYIDLTEQTLRAYDDCQLVFATLVSTGSNPVWTPPGRYNILYRIDYTRLTPPQGSLSVYDLQAVPYFMTLVGDMGIHGAYWHDDFGSPVSHGCINLSPADAQFLYAWARDGENVIIVRPE